MFFLRSLRRTDAHINRRNPPSLRVLESQFAKKAQGILTVMKMQHAYNGFILAVAAVVVISFSWFGAFVGLDTSSLWTDELFSTYFSDPSLKTVSDLLLRASEDVNPPGYYLLLWIMRKLTALPVELAGRVLSALLGCLVIVAVIFAPTRSVWLAPRLAGGAFGAGSVIWFFVTQEARAYALVLLLVACMAAMALRCMQALREGRTPVPTLIALTTLSIAASLTHYYGFLLAGGLFTMLLVFTRSVHVFATVTFAGLSILACMVAFVAWHKSQMVPDINNTWFSADPVALLHVAKSVTRQVVGSFEAAVFLGLLAVLGAGTLALRGIVEAWRALGQSDVGAALGLLVGACMFAYLYGVAVAVSFAPMLSHRLGYILAPVAWIGVAYAIQLVLTLGGVFLTRATVAILALALLPLSLQALERGRDTKQPWRHTAETVTALGNCIGATLPVVWWEQPYFAADDPEWFYGHYLPSDSTRKWLPIDRSALVAGLGSDGMRTLVRNTASGRRACPLLLWAVHSGTSVPTGEIVAALAMHLDPSTDAAIQEIVVRPRDGRAVGRLFLLRDATSEE